MAAIIYSAEPLWGAGLAWCLLDERRVSSNCSTGIITQRLALLAKHLQHTSPSSQPPSPQHRVHASREVTVCPGGCVPTNCMSYCTGGARWGGLARRSSSPPAWGRSSAAAAPRRPRKNPRTPDLLLLESHKGAQGRLTAPAALQWQLLAIETRTCVEELPGASGGGRSLALLCHTVPAWSASMQAGEPHAGETQQHVWHAAHGGRQHGSGQVVDIRGGLLGRMWPIFESSEQASCQHKLFRCRQEP